MRRLRIEEHLGSVAFSDLEAPWRELHRDARASPFLSHRWLRTWHRHFGGGRRPRLLTAWQEKELVGLLPLAAERLRPGGLPIPVVRLAFLGEKVAGADYLEALARPGREVEVTEAFFAHLAAHRSCDVLDLFEVAADSPVIPAAFRHFSGVGRAMTLLPRYVCPQIVLQGSWEEILRGSSRASNFKRRKKQLEALGAEYRQFREGGEAQEAFERFLTLHRRRWEAEGGSEGIGTPDLVAFHRDVVPELAEDGCLRFEELWVEGECRASIYGIDAGDSYFFYQSGFDPAWGPKSVGLVLLGHSIQRASERGVRVYDFLHGAEAYKSEWATRSRQTVAIRLTESGWGAAVLRAREEAEGTARAWAHAVLPDRAVAWLRRIRRAQERR